MSSENFQVDQVSVGGTQSAAATSSNFQTTQETGGLFELAEEGEGGVDNNDNGSSLRGRSGFGTSTNSRTDMSSKNPSESSAASSTVPKKNVNINDKIDSGEVIDDDAEMFNQFEADTPVTEKTIRRIASEPVCTHSWMVCLFPKWVPFALLLFLFWLLVILHRRGYRWW